MKSPEISWTSRPVALPLGVMHAWRLQICLLGAVFALFWGCTAAQNRSQHGQAPFSEFDTLTRAYSEAYQKRDYKTALVHAQAAAAVVERSKGKKGRYWFQAMRNVGHAYEGARDYTRALDAYQQALDAATKALRPKSPELADVHDDKGRALAGVGDLKGAADSYQRAIEMLEGAGGQQNISLSKYYGHLTIVCVWQGDTDRAATAAEKAVEIAQKLLGPDHATTISRTLDLISVYSNRADFDKASAILSEVERTIIRRGKEDALTASMYLTAGNLSMNRGELDKAIESYKKSVVLTEKINGQMSIEAATAYLDLGAAYRLTGELEKALEYLNKAASVLRGMGAQNSPLMGIVLVQLGNVLIFQNKCSQAIPAFEAGLRNEAQSERTSPTYIAGLNGLGMCYLELRQHDKAIKAFEDVLAMTEPSKMRNLKQYEALAWNNMGLVYAARKDRDKAAQCAAKAVELGEAARISDHSMATFYSNLASAYENQGQVERAIETYQKAIHIDDKGSLAEDRDGYLTILGNLGGLYANLKRPREAAAAYGTAVKALLQYRLDIGRQKAVFTQRYLYLFSRLITAELEQGHHEAAFAADMQRRGLSIAEDMTTKDALERGGVPEAEQNLLLEIVREVESLQSAYAASDAKTPPAAKLLDRIHEKEARRTQMETSLVERYPEYAKLRSLHPPSTAELQNRLTRDEVLISYSSVGGRLYAFAVDKERGLQLIPLPKSRQNVETDIRNLHAIASAEPGRTLCPCQWIKLKGGRRVLWNQGVDSPYEQRGEKVFADVRRGIEVVPRRPGTESAAAPGFVEVGTLDGAAFGESDALKEMVRLEVSLYADLLQPVVSGMPGPGSRHLIIVPDGPLYYLPFGLLRQQADAPGLLSLTDVKLAHSAAVWYNLRGAQAGHQAPMPLLAVGDAVYAKGYSDGPAERGRHLVRAGMKTRQALAQTRTSKKDLDSAEWNNLPGSGDEIRTIAGMAYEDPDVRKEHVLTGVKADRDLLVKLNAAGRLLQYRYLHFSVHGLFVDDHPELNALVFTFAGEAEKNNRAAVDAFRSKFGDPARDPYLRTGQVKSLRLNADVVVMSACETSLGHELGGEGMIGLPQAFLIAGSKNVIASLWSVPDAETSVLMQKLYDGMLRKGLRPAEALRAAQEEMRAKYPSPYYWAAFVIYGN